MGLEDLLKEVFELNPNLYDIELTEPGKELIESLNLEELNLDEFLKEFSNSCLRESTFPSSITAFRIYSCLKKMGGGKIPAFPFLAHLTCDEDIFVMAKVFVESARIKYNTISDEWYEALPAVLATIGQAYRSTGGIQSDELYNFEEHILKCILKHGESVKVQTVESLLGCLLDNPFLSTIPIKQIFG